jgi:hypothetical protein
VDLTTSTLWTLIYIMVLHLHINVLWCLSIIDRRVWPQGVVIEIKERGYNHTFLLLVTMAIWQYEQVIVPASWFPLETSLRCGTCDLSPWPNIDFIGWCFVGMLFLIEQLLVLLGFNMFQIWYGNWLIGRFSINVMKLL